MLIAPGDGSSASDTDSDQDEEDEDVHKLRQLARAARPGQPITAVLRWQYDAGARMEEVQFQSELSGRSAQSHIREPVQSIIQSLKRPAIHYGS
jgi:hypothetical protein